MGERLSRFRQIGEHREILTGAEAFAQTYRPVDRQKNPGAYIKTTPIWAIEAAEAGSVRTKEGVTHYNAGDFLVSNNPDGTDGYAIEREKFEKLYAPAPD